MNRHSIYKQLILCAVLPVLLFGLSITWFSYSRFTKTVYMEARQSMESIASGIKIAYEIKYEGDYQFLQNEDGKYNLYKGDTDITNDYSIIDDFSDSTDTEISLLYMDMRVHTTLTDSSGNRIAGLCTNAATTKTVIEEGNQAFYEDITITDSEYLVLYIPLRNSDGSVIGMIEVAKETTNLKKSVWKSVWPVLLLAIPGMALAAFISYRYTKKNIDALKAVQNFINKVSSGNLKAELDAKYLRRADEIGEISASVVNMQKSIRSDIECDPLTGLGNRRFVFNNFSKIADKSAITGVPFTLAFMDVDFFKKVNDTYGHNAGDEVLKAVAGKMKYAMQGKGFAARWGGEEFIMMFDKTNVEASLPTLERFLDEIRSMVVSTDGIDIKVTMTIGVSEGFSTDIDAVVEAADAKLYYGKQHGRNQIVTNI